MTATPAHIRWAFGEAEAKHLGWTKGQWRDLHAFFTGCEQPGGYSVAFWLRNPPEEFIIPITPAMVKDVFDRHGKNTEQVLTALAAGASERFTTAFLSPRFPSTDTVSGWQYATALNLTEPVATGWAGTGYLHSRVYQPDTHGRDTDVGAHITEWTSRFGPTAFLFILAGITLDEAIIMRNHHTAPSEQQLRVMVALAGHTLPAGV